MLIKGIAFCGHEFDVDYHSDGTVKQVLLAVDQRAFKLGFKDVTKDLDFFAFEKFAQVWQVQRDSGVLHDDSKSDGWRRIQLPEGEASFAEGVLI